MSQLEHIEAIEKRLWKSADTLRANSSYASNEYFMPVMGLVFLRHAYSRYLRAKEEIEPTLPSRGGKTRPLTKEDFSARSAIFLRPEAQFDHLVALPDSTDRIKAVIQAMDSIEKDYTDLQGALPKQEYQALDNEILGQLLRNLNPDELKQVSGDVFGRIYEYFLTQFAGQKAHDGGEFFTPKSIVSFMAHTVDPRSGKVLDPACGSGGMFVQSARTVEEHGESPMDKLTFYGLEKNPTTIRLAKMNLRVHGLEGNISKAITYYDHPHDLIGQCDTVMANPPFNVDEIDAEKIKTDPRLAFGLPGVNKQKKVSNGNYIWISYFYSYLNDTGRAAIVMSSQASSAGNKEADVRQKLIETGAVDIMVAIRSNFFYTRTVPCELWFLDKAKPAPLKDKVLMLDARGVFRKVTRKIYDFSPEQEKNLLAIVALHRNKPDAFWSSVKDHGSKIFNRTSPAPDQAAETIATYDALITPISEVLDLLPRSTPAHESYATFISLLEALPAEFQSLATTSTREAKSLAKTKDKTLPAFIDSLKLPAESQALIKSLDQVHKAATALQSQLSEASTGLPETKKPLKKLKKLLKEAETARQVTVTELKKISYFHRHARWLTTRFPEGKLIDVPGLVKLVDHHELAANDWSLTPGRYVGVAPEEIDEDFDFAETMTDIHQELQSLNDEAKDLAEIIQKNFEEVVA